ncbi:OLC1v1019497C1 [Oldenlandia corymbosa var. corymbosa]|uniref:OLC1v1019497C1 n=1 Tax=Oldenlandia corymbosa var. corymbosa TaxID=529605 RepID=A0AAV1EEJ4_OLDCO|nr:OLC1v1019497C1 [Oldenlandia corymbosa var. corymbosa]
MAMYLPFGKRFLPTDEELLNHFLRNKVANKNLPAMSEMMIERDIYGKNATPWELFRDDDPSLPWQQVVDSLGKLNEQEYVLYVFTKLTSVGKVGKKHKNRVAGCGSWHQNLPNEVTDQDGNKIGNKKIFKFKHRQEGIPTKWIMYEYSLLGHEEYVLCKIKRIGDHPSKNNMHVPSLSDEAIMLNTDDQHMAVDVQRSGKKSKLSNITTEITATRSQISGTGDQGLNNGYGGFVGNNVVGVLDQNIQTGDSMYPGCVVPQLHENLVPQNQPNIGALEGMGYDEFGHYLTENFDFSTSPDGGEDDQVQHHIPIGSESTNVEYSSCSGASTSYNINGDYYGDGFHHRENSAIGSGQDTHPMAVDDHVLPGTSNADASSPVSELLGTEDWFDVDEMMRLLASP